MNRTSLLLTSLMFASIAIFMTPDIIAMNRGKVLQTIALWLAIMLGLAVFYKNFGPESQHPLFKDPNGYSREAQPPAAADETPEPKTKSY